jgi:hypothetical protein
MSSAEHIIIFCGMILCEQAFVHSQCIKHLHVYDFKLSQ